MFDFNTLGKSVEKVASNLRALNNQLEEKKQFRENMQNLPVPREDFIAMLHESIDKKGSASKERFKQYYGAYMTSYQEDAGSFLESCGGGSHQGVINPDNIYNLFGGILKDAIKKEVMEWDWPEKVGPARKERVFVTQKLDNEIAEIEKQLDALMAKAEAAGLRVERMA